MCNCFGAHVLRCRIDVDKVVLYDVRKQLMKWRNVQGLSQHSQVDHILTLGSLGTLKRKTLNNQRIDICKS